MTISRVDIAILSTVAARIALGQYFFKRAGVSIRGASPEAALRILAQNPQFYIALALYGTSTVLWIFALSRMSLTQAYPWIIAASATVPLIGWLGFGERVNAGFWVGFALILAGLAITQFSAAK